MTKKLKHRQDFEVELSGQVFKLTCYYQSTSTGFRHLCFHTCMCKDGDPNTKDYIAKCVYYNRTWEEYLYEKVLRQSLEAIYQERMSNQISSAMETVRRAN